MASCPDVFGALGDELIVKHIISRVEHLRGLFVACKRLNRLVRSSVTTLHLNEEIAPYVARLPSANTYSGCRGLTFEVKDIDDPGLPGFTEIVSHISRCWPALTDLAITVARPSDVNAATRQGNHAVLWMLQHLISIHSLRQLQLFKTAPFTSDAAHLAGLMQLTALVLADNSYIPGPAALVTVPMSPLATMTNLRGLAVLGICPQTASPTTAAADTQGCGSYCSSAGCLPNSLTALVLKDFDAGGVRLWLPHVLTLSALQVLHVHCYSERPSGVTHTWSANEAHDTYPAQYLELVSDRLTSLRELVFGMDDKVERQWGSPKCALPVNVTNLQQLEVLQTPGCQLTIGTRERWEALGKLSRLHSLSHMEVACAPPARFVVSSLSILELSMSTINWVTGGSISLHNSFPNLRGLCIRADSPELWLSVVPCIQECSKLQQLGLDIDFEMDAQCEKLLKELGASLPEVVALSLRWGSLVAQPPLLDLSTFSQVTDLTLRLVQPYFWVKEDFGDAHLMALLAHTTKLHKLVLWDFTAITPAILLGLQALLPRLRLCCTVCSISVFRLSPGDEGWEGSAMQVVDAALRADLQWENFATYKSWQRKNALPWDVQYLDPYMPRF